MKVPTMNEQEFADLLDRFGSDTSIWPTEAAALAEDLLQRSAAAREALTAARTLDAALSKLERPAAPAQISLRILNRIARQDPWDRWMGWFAAALWRPALAAVVPLVIGFAIGIQSAPATDALLIAELSELPLSANFEDTVYDD